MSDTEKVITLVKSSTQNILGSFKSKTDALKRLSPPLKLLLRESYDKGAASSAAKALFKSQDVDFLAIDGTLARDQQLDMIIFYAGSFGYQGRLAFSDTGVAFGETSACQGAASISSAIPIYEENQTSISGEPTEGGVEVDPERVPNALMHLSEYYLAVKKVQSDPKIKVVLMDRTLAGDVGHLVWSVKDHLDSGLSILLSLETPHGKVTGLDLELARMLHPNRKLRIPVPRSQFIKYAAIQSLFAQAKPLHESDLLLKLGMPADRLEKLRRELRRLDEDYAPFTGEKGFRLVPGAENYWERVFHAAMKVADHIFDTPAGGHPLIYTNGKTTKWITTGDLEYITLIMVYALLRMAWEQGILVIGLIKDTMAHELVKTIIPLLKSAEMLKVEGFIPDFNSDKALLQTFSVINSKNVKSPWRTIEFDVCFRTMAPDEDFTLGKGEARVRGAYKNVVSDERLFVKSYIQLWQSTEDPSIRSHVFSYDRPCYPDFDRPGELKLHHRDGTADEIIEPIINFQKDSPVSHLVMAILHSMAQETIPEALGHNYPLFLADKKAKVILDGTRKAYLATVALEVTKSQFDQQVLFNQKFRDFRSEIEWARKKGSK